MPCNGRSHVAERRSRGISRPNRPQVAICWKLPAISGRITIKGTQRAQRLFQKNEEFLLHNSLSIVYRGGRGGRLGCAVILADFG